MSLPFNFSSPLTPKEILPYLRLVRVLFPDPERALAFIAIRLLDWSAPEFVAKWGDHTLKEIERQLERELVERGLPAAVIGYALQPLQHILCGRPPRDVSAAAGAQAQGDCALREFFTFNAVTDVLHWCLDAATQMRLVAPLIEAGDDAFDEMWAEQEPGLVRVLGGTIRRDLTTAEDIAQSTWLAIRLTHDTSATWKFSALWKIAREIHRRETRGGADVIPFDDAISLGACFNRRRRTVPAYVKIALLEAIFDPANPPHEILAILLRWMLRMTPRKIVRLFAASTLYGINSSLFAAYYPSATVPDPVVHELFSRFDARLKLTFARVIRHQRMLHRRRRLLKDQAGWTVLADYLRTRNPEPRAREISRWLENIIRRLFVLRQTPGSPLHQAFERWREELDGVERDSE